MAGLLQKFYLHNGESDRVGSIYVFDSDGSRDAFFGSDLHAELRDGPDVRALDTTTFRVVSPRYESEDVSASVDFGHSPDTR